MSRPMKTILPWSQCYPSLALLWASTDRAKAA